MLSSEDIGYCFEVCLVFENLRSKTCVSVHGRGEWGFSRICQFWNFGDAFFDFLKK